MSGTTKKPGEIAAKAVRAAPSLAPKAIESEIAEVAGVEADFLAFINEARGVDAAKVTSFRGDPSLAYHNVVTGLEAVLAERDKVVASGLHVDWRALQEAPRIALGLVFACERIDGTAGVNRALQTDLARGRVLRDIALSSIASLASSGAIPADSPAKLKSTAGPLNLGKLLVKIAGFFSKHRDAVKGMTPFKPELASEAAAVGARLLKTAKPVGAIKVKPRQLADAQRDRDAMAALLSLRLEALDRVGGSLWGRELADHIPSMQSRLHTSKKTGAKKTPAQPVTQPAAPNANAPR